MQIWIFREYEFISFSIYCIFIFIYSLIMILKYQQINKIDQVNVFLTYEINSIKILYIKEFNLKK